MLIKQNMTHVNYVFDLFFKLETPPLQRKTNKYNKDKKECLVLEKC